LAEIHRLLPLIAARKTMELLEEFKNAHAKIAAVPASVEEWVEIHQFLNEVHDKQDNQKQRTTFVEELYGLMHKHGNLRLLFESPYCMTPAPL
jgi:predicted acetyltransferase